MASLTAQTGPWTDGELLVRAPNLAGALTLYRINPNTGEGAVLRSPVLRWGGAGGSMVFDSYRGGVLANMSLPPDNSSFSKLWLVRADGSATSIPGLDGASVRALAPTGDGRVYFQDNTNAATLPIRYLDAGDNLSMLLDATGTAPLAMRVERLIYHAPSNALIALSGVGLATACMPNSNSIHRIPLSPDGSRVAGPIQCSSFGSAYEYGIGLDQAPGGTLFLTVGSTFLYPNKLVRLDPVTLARSVYSPVDPQDLNGGCYSARLGRAIVLDDVANELRTFGAGQGGAGTLLPCTVPVGDNTTGGGWNQETMIELDVSGPACQGLAYAYGAGLAGTGNIVPTLGVAGCPRLQTSFSIAVTRAVGGAPGLLVLGTQPAAVPVVGGTLHVLPSVTLPLACNGQTGVPGAGSAGTPLQVSDPVLIGAAIYFQAALLDVGAVQSIALTNGLQVVIG